MRALPLLFLAGCVAGEIHVTSEPSNARVIVTQEDLTSLTEDGEPKVPAGSGYYSHRTPATFRRPGGGPWRIYVAKAGYWSAKRDVEPNTSSYHFILVEKKP